MVVVRHGVQVVSITADGLQAAVAVHQHGFRQGVCDGPCGRGRGGGPEKRLGLCGIGMHLCIGAGIDPQKSSIDVCLLFQSHQVVVRYGDIDQAGMVNHAARSRIEAALVRQFPHQAGVCVFEQIPEDILVIVGVFADLIADI